MPHTYKLYGNMHDVQWIRLNNAMHRLISTCSVEKHRWIRFSFSTFLHWNVIFFLNIDAHSVVLSILMTFLLYFFCSGMSYRYVISKGNHLHYVVARGNRPSFCTFGQLYHYYVHCIMCLPRILMWIRI